MLLQVLAARDEMQWGEAGPPPLLVKIAPDLSKQDLADIAAVKSTSAHGCCLLLHMSILDIRYFFMIILLSHKPEYRRLYDSPSSILYRSPFLLSAVFR